MNESSPQSADGILISGLAAVEIKRLMEAKELPETAGVRVGVRGGGCSGYTYTLDFDYKPAEGDLIFDQQGVRVFCDPKALSYLEGTTLDFTDGLMGKGFQFKNPKATGTCGCGESFSV